MVCAVCDWRLTGDMSAGKDMCSLALVHQVCKTFEVHPGSGGESIEFGREPHWTQIR